MAIVCINNCETESNACGSPFFAADTIASGKCIYDPQDRCCHFGNHEDIQVKNDNRCYSVRGRAVPCYLSAYTWTLSPESAVIDDGTLLECRRHTV